MLDNDTPMITVEVGQNHSMAVNAKSQLFTWGINDRGQCGISFLNRIFVPYDKKSKSSLPQFQARIKQIACGNCHSVLLDKEGNVHVWGSNTKGQLGNGNYEDSYQPQKLTNGIPCGEVKQIAVCGDINFAVTNEGSAYMWPTQDEFNITNRMPIKLPFTSQVIFIFNYI